jgi:tetratricopeptide (TPR) repeat protein
MASQGANLRAGATTLVLVLATGFVPFAAARSGTLDPGLVAYHESVSRYRSGDTGAVPVIEAWSGEQLVATAAKLWRIDARERASSGWNSTAITGACLLHLEVMARHPDQPFRQALHMKIFRQHLAGLRRDPASAPLTARLTLVLALYLQSQLKVEDLHSLFDEIGDMGASDGELLLARGSMHELFASHRLEAARQAGLVPGAKPSLQEAERLLRRCLAVAPQSLGARLHLARVVIAQGRPEESVALLEPIVQASRRRDERYLAYLLLGQAHLLAGRPDAAAKAFSASVAESSCGWAAAVALAHLAFREQRFDAATDVLKPALRHPVGCADPWATYDFGPVARLATLIDELKRDVRP